MKYWGRDFKTHLIVPVKDAWNRNINHWEEFLENTVPEVRRVYGTDIDYAFEERGILSLPREANNNTALNDSLVPGAYHEKERTSSHNSLKRRILLGGATALALTYLISSTSCAPHEIKPEDKDITRGNITVDTDKDGLTDEEETKYGTDPLKTNPVFAYALKKNPEFYSSHTDILSQFEKDGKLDDNERWFIDEASNYSFLFNSGLMCALNNDGSLSNIERSLVTIGMKYPKIIDNVPKLYCEILSVPEMSTIEENDIKAVERIFILANDPKYKPVFEQMSYGLLRPLFWVALDRELNQSGINPLDNFSPDKLLDEAWKNTNTGKSYNLGDFRSVVEMLKGSPIAISKYMRDNFKNLGVCRSNGMGMHIADSYIFQPAEKTFKEKGGDPTDLAMFGLTLLLEDKEWSYDNFEVNKNNAACVLTSFKLTYFGEKTSESTHTEGSATTLYIQNGSFYIIDTGYRGNCNISGPFKTIDDAAYATFPGFGYTDYFNLKTYDKYELLNIVNKYNKK